MPYPEPQDKSSPPRYFAISQANTYRLYQSMIATRYRNPLFILIEVISVLQTWSGVVMTISFNTEGYFFPSVDDILNLFLGEMALNSHQSHESLYSLTIYFIPLKSQPGRHLPGPIKGDLRLLLIYQSHQEQIILALCCSLIVVR